MTDDLNLLVANDGSLGYQCPCGNWGRLDSLGSFVCSTCDSEWELDVRAVRRERVTV